MSPTRVLVTGANGYIGYAVTKAFVRAGWKAYGLTRKAEGAKELAKNEIHPLIGSPGDLSFLEKLDGVVSDVIVSNTEDNRSVESHNAHYKDVANMLGVLAKRSQSAAIRPLIIFTSGCKGYGSMESPLNAPERLRGRADLSKRLLGGNDLFDAIVTRPTIVHGYKSSYVSALFATASKSQSMLRNVGDSNTIMHSLHVDDCAEAYIRLAEAYIRLAEHPVWKDISGQAFNMSNEKYETIGEVCQALAKVYGLELELVAPTDSVPFMSIDGLTN